MNHLRMHEINPSLDSRWDELVEKHPLGCVFHHSAWKKVIEKTFPQVKPSYHIVEDDDGTVRGGIPLFYVKSWLTRTRLVSLPFSLYCDPLVYFPAAFTTLLDGILSRHERCGAAYIVFRTIFSSHLFKDTGFKEVLNYKNHSLLLDSELQVMKKSFHRTCVRQRITRAEKSNLIVKEASSEEDVRTFYELHCMTRKKYGVPPQPYSFFSNMWKFLYPENMLGILIAQLEDQPVGTILFLKYKQRVHAEYMGINEAFLNLSPNVFLFWDAIQKAKNEGYRFFDFGGSHASHLDLIKFKRRWGTSEHNITHYYFPSIKGASADFETSARYKAITQISRKMPDQFFKWTGSFLYRHLGG